LGQNIPVLTDTHSDTQTHKHTLTVINLKSLNLLVKQTTLQFRDDLEIRNYKHDTKENLQSKQNIFKTYFT